MQISKASNADIPGLSDLFCDLHSLHVKLYPKIFRPLSPDEASKAWVLLASDEEANIFIASEGSRIIGFVLFRKKVRRETSIIYARTSIFIEQIAVEARSRRKGVAKLLLGAVEEYAHNSNILSVELDVWVANPVALKFFNRMGYTVYNQLLSKHILT